MNIRPPRVFQILRALRAGRRHGDRGFTLIELMFALVLSGLIAGVLTAAMITALNVSKSTTNQIGDSTDTGLLSAFLIRDAQSSGGIDPGTGLPNKSLGVAADTATPDWEGCIQYVPGVLLPDGSKKPAQFVVRFSWIDRTVASPATVVVTYALIPDPLDSTKPQLVRRTCRTASIGSKASTTVDVILARHLTTVVVSCLSGSQPNTTCGGQPTSVSLSVNGSSVSLNSSGVQTPYSATLTASFRSVPSQLTISSPANLPAGQVGVVYRTLPADTTASTTLITFGSGAPPTWSTTTLPAGLTIDAAAGTLSGTPTAAGNFSVTVTASDPSTSTSKTIQLATVSKTYSIKISSALIFSGPATLPVGQSGVSYTPTQMTFSGGTAPNTWTQTGLPAGLTLTMNSDGTGKIAGTPTVSGTFPVVVTVTDSMTGSATKTYSLVVTAALGVSTASLPAGQVGVGYSTSVVSTGGTAPFTWTASGLPTGLTINASGAISGTPAAAGTVGSVTINVTDAAGGTAIKTYTVVITAALAVSTASLPNGQVGVAYSTTVASTGGTAPYTWTASGLPAGLTFNASNQTISGTPTVAGPSTLTFKVTDAVTYATKPLTVTIAAAVAVCPGSVVGWRGEYYSNMTLTAPAVLCRDDADPINFNWGSGSPDPAVPVDNFSVRWTRTQNFAAGYYTFTLGSDDGGRLYIDGNKVIDSWVPRSYTTSAPYSVFIADGSHTIVMEYYEQGGNAQASLKWVASTPPACSVAANGWLGQYFSNVTLAGLPAACRDDADPLNFNWGNGVPFTGMASDNFSVSWTKSPQFAAGTYNFALGSDDGARLYIDNVLALDDWNPPGPYTTPPPSVTKTLAAGVHALRVEYYDVSGLAQLTLVVAPASPPPAPTLAFSAFSNTYWSGTGSVVYYRSTADSGSFTTTATSTDAAYGITSYGFLPASFGTNWTSTPGSLGVNRYSWSGAPAAPVTPTVTATNGAGLTSTTSSFTPTIDNTAPTNGTVTYADGPSPATTVNVSFTTGVDAGSGVATRLLQRQSATLTGSTCGTTYGAFATLTNGTNPTSPVADTVVLGNCYKYQYLVYDNVGNLNTVVGTSVVKVRKTYFNTVNDTTGLLSYWRLGETSGSSASDTFTGTAGTVLQNHTGEIGATWAKPVGSSSDSVFTANGRIRKDGSNSLGALYSSSAVPSSADYTVQADVYVASQVTNDVIGVVGRLDPNASAGTYYAATYELPTQKWTLSKKIGGSYSWIQYTNVQVLTVGTTYRLALDMSGTTIRLLVNGVQQLSVSDSSITAAGRGGVVMGYGQVAQGMTDTDTTGMQLDNFFMSTASSALVDSRNVNNGTYLNGPTFGVGGAISGSGDLNTAVTFDGINEYGTVARQISGDFSIEFWFKSLAGGVSTGSNWWEGAGMVDAEMNGTSNDFGVALRSDGRVVAGDGATNDVSIVSSTSTGKDGSWHHVVFTRTQSTGVMVLYMDGVSTGSAGGGTALVNGPAAITFGRTQSGTQYFAGSLDEVAIYTSVLDSATVLAHFNAAS